MTVEALIYTALKGLVPGAHVYARKLPDTVTAATYVTYQQVGGNAVNFLDPTVPSKKNGRFQINSWAATPQAASALARAIEDAMRATGAYVLGAPVDTGESDLDIFGARQDFSLWF